jgi:uncharacterized protein YoxC
MRALLAAVAASVAMLTLGACETAEEVRSGVEEARTSAASIGAGVRTACRASETELTRLDDLATKLADNPDLRVQLAPQVRQTVQELTASIGDRAELQPVLTAARDLSESVGEANRTSVEVSARQTQLAARSAKALCDVAR